MVVKHIVQNFPMYLVELFNSCLHSSVIPVIKKRQKLVLLSKNDKPSEDPSSYRPICLIDTFGKLFESIICARLQAYIETVNGLAETQFGFRRARSTTDAIAMVISKLKKQLMLKATTTTTA